MLDTDSGFRPKLGSSIFFMRDAHRKSGQAMLFTIMLLSSALLGGTALVGFLMIHQLRQAADVSSSAQAIFAADAGVECALYNFQAGEDCPLIVLNECGALTPVELSNDATYSVEWINDNDDPAPDQLCDRAISTGKSRGSGRAFEVALPQVQ